MIVLDIPAPVGPGLGLAHGVAGRFRREDAELFRRVRRPIPSLDGVSLMDLLARGDTPALLAVCRDMFRFDRAHA